jgi:signal transduction histidine kinase
MVLTDLAPRVERDHARAEALGFVTHELRTPLVSIQGFAEVMMRYPESPANATAPETIFRESRRLLALINSYLDVLRLDAGARAIRSEAVQMGTVVRQVFEIVQPLAAAAGMTLTFQDGANVAVQGDEVLLTGAVLNLVSNAIKYGTPGTEVRVRCATSGATVVFSVHNHGEPIAAQDLARLCEPFYRSPEAESAKTGWGLGLAFVKRIAEKHGGSVRVQNTDNGVLFEVHLPVAVQVFAAKGTL